MQYTTRLRTVNPTTIIKKIINTGKNYYILTTDGKLFGDFGKRLLKNTHVVDIRSSEMFESMYNIMCDDGKCFTFIDDEILSFHFYPNDYKYVAINENMCLARDANNKIYVVLFSRVVEIGQYGQMIDYTKPVTISGNSSRDHYKITFLTINRNIMHIDYKQGSRIEHLSNIITDNYHREDGLIYTSTSNHLYVSDNEMCDWLVITQDRLPSNIEIFITNGDTVISFTSQSTKTILQLRTWRDNIDRAGQLCDVVFKFCE